MVQRVAVVTGSGKRRVGWYVADALARIRDPDLPVPLAAQVFVCQPPLETPTGRFQGVVGIQRLLREAPSKPLGRCVDEEWEPVAADASDRDVDDLRLAFSALTTYWYRMPGRSRLRIGDLNAFHRAFGSHRFATADSTRGTLNRDQLLAGAAGLLGDWFPEAYADDDRRGWGIAFPTAEERHAYDPEDRLKLAKLGRLTPESATPLSDVAVEP